MGSWWGLGVFTQLGPEPNCRTPPFTPLVLYPLAQAAVNRGWTDTAVLLILGFHSFARAGELFQARVGDFVLGSSSGTWTLPLSKSVQRAGAVESILLTDAFVVVLLSNFCRGKQAGDLLSQVAPGTQRKRLYELLADYKLEPPYRWYSVRRGGAIVYTTIFLLSVLGAVGTV